MPSNSRAVELSSAQADRASAGLSGFAAEYANYDGLGLAKLIADKQISPPPENYDLWLDPAMQNVAGISDLLRPYDARLMRCYPISIRVNHVANDDAECSRPAEVAEAQDRLFF
jgi:hypothetical protein